ncbi:hypothetical protein HMPREF0322_05199 [Desulfitobacterium hafniense DP7]|uniref:Uncharacterized protein n=1 Tax=Desulfitobacterium hafniense DP7 TaxID=537010 RepID=G9XW16_DESHA|nr:hypothetical protein HMPREF0322_05199 [Desulfitobacterium hafniense DP7]
MFNKLKTIQEKKLGLKQCKLRFALLFRIIGRYFYYIIKRNIYSISRML